MPKGKYRDDSTNDEFPKTLLIKNEFDGLFIWQIYHPENEEDVKEITDRAYANGFWGISLVDFDPEKKETFPNWRTEKVW